MATLDGCQALEEITSTLPKEVAGLQQTVSGLCAQVAALEVELQELKLSKESETASTRSPPALHDTSDMRSAAVNSAGIDSSPLPPPSSHPPQLSTGLVESDPEHLGDQQQEEEHAIAPGEYLYASPMDASASVFGPFVSVPMSVLPPRTKLHWDMCEFISQLQADSNARLPAQMAALRLCTAAVQSLWPRAQVRPYGSFVSRLVLPSRCVPFACCGFVCCAMVNLIGYSPRVSGSARLPTATSIS